MVQYLLNAQCNLSCLGWRNGLLYGGLLFYSCFFIALSTFWLPALFALVLPTGYFLIAYPPVFLWLFILFQWTLYIPYLGAKIQHIAINLGSFSFFIKDFFFVTLWGYVLLSFLFSRRRKEIMHYPLSKWILLFMMYIFFQMVRAVKDGLSLDTAIRAGAGYLVCAFFFYVLFYFRKSEFGKVLKFAYGLFFAIPVFQMYMLAKGITWYTDSGSIRTYFIGPNIFFLAIIIYKLLIERVSLPNIAILLYFVGGMVMTQYRSAFIALCLSFVFFLFFVYRDRDTRKMIIYPVVTLSFALLAMFFLFIINPNYATHTYQRYFTEYQDKGNIANRAGLWTSSFYTFKQHPVIGIGFGKSFYADTDKKALFGNDSRGEWSPHNFFIRLLVQLGLVGAGIVLCIFYFYIRCILIRTPNDCSRDIARYCLTYFLAILLIHLMNATFVMDRTGFVLWILTGGALLFLGDYSKVHEGVAVDDLLPVPLLNEDSVVKANC